MHCPRCGQKQVSDDTKFCSGCGFQLGLVSELLVHGGFLPQLAEIGKKHSVFTRRNGFAFSLLWCVFFLLIMAPFWNILDVDPLAQMSAVIGIFGGLMLLLSSKLFLKKAQPTYDLPSSFLQNSQPASLHGTANQATLPPQQSQPVSSYVPPEGSWKSPDIGEFAHQGSVTDSTTKLLQKERDD